MYGGLPALEVDLSRNLTRGCIAERRGEFCVRGRNVTIALHSIVAVLLHLEDPFEPIVRAPRSAGNFVAQGELPSSEHWKLGNAGI